MIKFIYKLEVLDYYSYNSFCNLCSHLNILKYDSIKLNISELIKMYIKDIKKICNSYNIELIISFTSDNNINNINNYINIIDNIEVLNEKSYIKFKNDFKKIIINTNIENFKSMTQYDTVLINNPNKIDNYDIFNNNNVGIETENMNNIWHTIVGVNIFSFIHTKNITNNEWSIINKTYNYNIPYNCKNYLNKYKKIIITGISGQDGSILGEYLLNLKDNNIIIIGTIKTESMLKHNNIKKLINNKSFCPLLLDLCDSNYNEHFIKMIEPDYIFNCAAQSTVYNTTSQNIENTFIINTIAPLRHLELIKKYCPQCRYLSCGSSEEFGNITYSPQDIHHPYNPINIYGITKNTTHNLIKYYRNNYNLYCCHAILYNHESIKRDLNFLTRKISNEIAKIKIQIDNNIIPKPIQIGNIYSKRDWSSCEDIVEAFWKILNMSEPDDYILSSGETHTVKEFIDIGFEYINMPLTWDIKNNIFDTKAYFNKILLIEINKDYYRENDDNRYFQGNNTISKNKLNWNTKITFKQLIYKMIDNDILLLKNNINNI